ncbi:TetR family transcriptional regulator [Cellulomonas hominis]
MRSADPTGPGAESDLTARARIRDAAIERFGRDGFGASVRAIATQAGVSPALVIHHFGSKDGLREACDDYVTEFIVEIKSETLADTGSQHFLQQLAQMDEYTWLFGYIVRSLQAGGALAVSMFERMVRDVEQYFEIGEAAGTIRPSRDPAARARWVSLSGLGAMLLLIALRHPGDRVDYTQVMHDWADEYTLPSLEMYTEGVLTDHTILDGYLAYRADADGHPAGATAAAGPGRPDQT